MSHWWTRQQSVINRLDISTKPVQLHHINLPTLHQLHITSSPHFSTLMVNFGMSFILQVACTSDSAGQHKNNMPVTSNEQWVVQHRMRDTMVCDLRRYQIKSQNVVFLVHQSKISRSSCLTCSFNLGHRGMAPGTGPDGTVGQTCYLMYILATGMLEAMIITNNACTHSGRHM